MDTWFFIFVLIGFGAQMIDGGLGMGYGMISMSILMALGIPPSLASAAVHTSEIFTTGFSGASHLILKNVDYNLFRSLVIPGALGGIIGSFLLTIITVQIKPFIALYLLIMASFIVYKAVNFIRQRKKIHPVVIYDVQIPDKLARRKWHLIILGFVGGFCDAVGGGGWGAIVISTLLAQGEIARYTIGSVNLAECVVTISISIMFFLTIGIKYWPIIIGLVVGGAIAAPISAYITRIIPAHLLMFLVSLLISVISLKTLWSIMS
ncbi:sulfite exporter TauE/SafE family protein [Legionella cardiaca]|uniref:Probable membrane transporter protein n=1 Tax=Legionella cardiaca TaxID=1071983 RepID=A0ABY8AXS8_9GAMM|nr:sulfite exporter TauE/SafE family protein [Legionella cardiaca]WED44271.1 sulfite exporter TauE/SafE family protein [Legionella cardiaca]